MNRWGQGCFVMVFLDPEMTYSEKFGVDDDVGEAL
jgi:hypothetical protein